MKFFWPIYFLSAFVGTAGVYVAAPLTRPYVAALFGTREEKQPVSEGTGTQGAIALKPAPAPAPSRPAAPAAAEEGNEGAPVMKGLFLVTRSSDKPGWGITFQRATYYGLDGTRMGFVPGGVMLDYRNTRVSSVGTMVECVLLENGTPSAPLLVNKKDILLFTGSHTKLTAQQRADLQVYYALSGKIGLRKIELLQAAAAKNPFFATYNQTYKNYMTHVQEAKELTTKRDQATGTERTQIEDQLHTMKMAETALRQDYDASQAKFRVWKEQHAKELPTAENDPDVKKWTQEMDALRSGLLGLTL